MWVCDWYNRFGPYLAAFAAPSGDIVTLYRSAESIREVYQEPLLCGKTKSGQQILSVYLEAGTVSLSIHDTKSIWE